MIQKGEVALDPAALWEVPRDPGTLKNLRFPKGKLRISKNHLFEKVERPGGPHDPIR